MAQPGIEPWTYSTMSKRLYKCAIPTHKVEKNEEGNTSPLKESVNAQTDTAYGFFVLSKTAKFFITECVSKAGRKD